MRAGFSNSKHPNAGPSALYYSRSRVKANSRAISSGSHCAAPGAEKSRARLGQKSGACRKPTSRRRLCACSRRRPWADAVATDGRPRTWPAPRSRTVSCARDLSYRLIKTTILPGARPAFMDVRAVDSLCGLPRRKFKVGSSQTNSLSRDACSEQ